jgi:hypothetical protein
VNPHDPLPALRRWLVGAPYLCDMLERYTSKRAIFGFGRGRNDGWFALRLKISRDIIPSHLHTRHEAARIIVGRFGVSESGPRESSNLQGTCKGAS